MSRELPNVQHWIVCKQVVADPPTHQLEDVSYLYAFDPETGFPRPDDPDALPPAAPRLDVFCRLFGGSGVMGLEIRLGWLDAPAPVQPLQVEVFGPYRIEFRADEPVRDMAFQLPQVPFFGYGRYAVELVALPEADANGRPPAGVAAEVLAVEYFVLVPES
jgi:hypothetical protein